MLIRFTAANHRSIKDPVELSLVAVDRDRPIVRHFRRLNEGVLPVAAIYGPNASGKSNILDALVWLAFAVRNSLRLWDSTIPRCPFRFAGFPTEASLYELDFMHEGVRHTYTLQLTDIAVLHEELVSYPERKPRTLFLREESGVKFRRGMAGTAAIKELIGPTTLILTLAQRLDVPELRGPARFIGNISTPFMQRRRGRFVGGMPSAGLDGGMTSNLFFEAHGHPGAAQQGALFPGNESDELATARALLRLADLGIEDVEVIELADMPAGGDRRDIRLVHKVGMEKELFELTEESDGTRMWFSLLGPALSALTHGHPLVLDEIDSSLHPLLSVRLVELFRSPSTNPNNAQLVFTSHDASLLGELSRDEVWFTEKGSDGATTLTALAEYGGERVRRSLNLERAYLQGRFGALPNLRDSELLAASRTPRDAGDRSDNTERSRGPDDDPLE